MVFEDLQAFVIVARHGSFAQAAAALSVAQSALSKRVQRLEERLGAALFERRPRGVVLTEAGHAFLARAQRLVDDLTDLERNFSSLVHMPAGEVRIALPQRTAGLLAPPVIERCSRELPLVNLHVLEGTASNVHGWLMRGEADIAISYNADVGAGFSVRPVLVEPLFLFVAARAAAQHFDGPVPERCTIADLANLPLVLPRRPNPVRVLIDRLAGGHGLKPRILFETDGTATLRGVVERGLGVSVFSMSTTWSYAVESGAMLAIPFTSPLMNWKMHLMRNTKDAGAVAISRVHEIVEQEIEQLLHVGAWPYARRVGPEGGVPGPAVS
ncbi:MAG: LysR family transcriptional regulator [Variovorax sp.]|nr:LysR family transcriptional regulator [Variovorax sp.]